MPTGTLSSPGCSDPGWPYEIRSYQLGLVWVTLRPFPWVWAVRPADPELPYDTQNLTEGETPLSQGEEDRGQMAASCEGVLVLTAARTWLRS